MLYLFIKRPSSSIINPFNHVSILSYRTLGTGAVPSRKDKDDGNLTTKKKKNIKDSWTTERVNGYVGHTFPDFIEFWNRNTFHRVGYGLTGTTVTITGLTAISVFYQNETWTLLDSILAFLPSGILGSITTWYWIVGLRDIKQTQHAVRRNYPLLGNMRYILETVCITKLFCFL